MYHVFVYVNQTINSTFPATRRQTLFIRTSGLCKVKKAETVIETSHRYTYLISSDGKWGRKSLPTKKHMNTQSSMLLSTSNGNGKLAMVSSLSRYYNQRRMLTSKQWKEHVWGMPVPIITETYLSKNIQPKEDKLPFCTRKTICKFIML